MVTAERSQTKPQLRRKAKTANGYHVHSHGRNIEQSHKSCCIVAQPFIHTDKSVDFVTVGRRSQDERELTFVYTTVVFTNTAKCHLH